MMTYASDRNEAITKHQTRNAQNIILYILYYAFITCYVRVTSR